MRLLVLADIHANELALEAVLTHARRERVDQRLCLGDLVGYGANPTECVAKIQELDARVVAGNHDVDALKDSPLAGTQPAARHAQIWTREQLTPGQADYLRELPRIVMTDEYVAVHGCYLNPTHYSGYVTTTMLERNMVAVADDQRYAALSFCGHTHTPMFGYLKEGKCFEPRVASNMSWPRDCQAILVNPGSVGQPRDGDRRAAYAIVDTHERTVAFRRVEYDVREASRRIERAGLPLELGDRLMEGR